jgi:hypothetical protein
VFSFWRIPELVEEEREIREQRLEMRIKENSRKERLYWGQK